MDLLLIDPDPFSLKAYQNVFELWGFSVTPCSNGSDLREILKERAFDAIVTEMDLPGMERGRLISELRERLPRQPLIVLTENVSIRSAIQAIRSGADDYVLKPISPQKLHELVQRHVNRLAEGGREKVSVELEELTSSLHLSIHKAIDHLHEKEDYIRFLELLHRVSFEQISDAVFMIDDRGRLLLINERMRELLGVDDHFDTKAAFWEQFPDLADSFREIHQQMAEKGHQNGRFENVIFERKKDGRQFSLDGQITSVRMASRRKRRMATVFVINRIEPLKKVSDEGDL